MGEMQNRPFQLSFNASLKIDFRGSRVLLIPCDENHVGVEGCDYDIVAAETAAQVRPAQITLPTAAASNAKLSHAELMKRFHSMMARRNRRFGMPQASPN